jgi:hypothetical protein
MKKIIFILLLSIAFINHIKAQQLYFPKGSIDTFTNKWYSKQLIAMNEPVLYTSKSTDEIYRFTWLRTFDHPIAITITKHRNSYLLIWRECSGAGGYKPGEIIVNKQKKITKANWDFFQYRLKQLGFWKLATEEKDVMGNDGAQWILEGKTPNAYHVTDRWTPGPGTDYNKCCDYLLSLTDLQIVKDRKY